MGVNYFLMLVASALCSILQIFLSDRCVTINDINMQQICIDIGRGVSDETLVKTVMASRLRETVIAEVLHCLNQECCLLSKRQQTSLKLNTLEDINCAPNSDWLDTVPLLNDILNTVLNVNKKPSEKITPVKSFLGACLLFGRSQRNSGLPYMIGLTLDQGGLTNEVSECIHVVATHKM